MGQDFLDALYNFWGFYILVFKQEPNQSLQKTGSESAMQNQLDPDQFFLLWIRIRNLRTPLRATDSLYEHTYMNYDRRLGQFKCERKRGGEKENERKTKREINKEYKRERLREGQRGLEKKIEKEIISKR